MSELWSLTRREGPIIVNVPHAGTLLPDGLAPRLSLAGSSLPDTDWHVEKLYASLATEHDVTLMWARYSRYVVDLNRDPLSAVLYPGASNTETCPSSTFHDELVYLPGAAPGETEIAARVERFWHPYHQQLAAEIERVKLRHRYCILLDAHSIVSEVPRFFSGRLPDLNLGTADETSCAPTLAAAAFEVLNAAPGFTAVHNGRFKGGYITRHFGRPADEVHAIQLEMAQSCYMDESQPLVFDNDRAMPLKDVLHSLLNSLREWRPTPGKPANQ